MTKILMSLLLAGTTAAPAFAQDPSVAPFSGPRVEAIVGHDTTDITGYGDASGAVYGLGIGYDHHAGQLVVGLEAELTDSKAEERTENGLPAGTLLSRGGRDIYAGVRAGAALSPGILVYGKVGYTNAAVSTSWGNGLPGAGVDRDFKLSGYRLGGGAEVSLSSNLFIKAEYRYSSYSQPENDFVGGTAVAPIRLVGDRDKQQFVAGFGFRF